jgi:GR25 family glycosyltransferase involved in LPS biosynthesis
MKHNDTLFIVTSLNDDVCLYLDGEEQHFNVILVIKEKTNKITATYEETEKLKQKYKEQGIDIHSALYSVHKNTIDILRELSLSNQIKNLVDQVPDPRDCHIGFMFDETVGCTSEINGMFLFQKEMNWKYAHPGSDSIDDPELFILNWNSYIEYIRYAGHGVMYTCAPYLPFVSPFFHIDTWNIVEKLLKQYLYNSEQAFVQYWIPEALSRQSEQIYPVILKYNLIEYNKTKKPKKDPDFKEAKEACYPIIRSLYPGTDEIEVKCISLSDQASEARKQQFQASAEKYELDFEFWQAFDGRKLTRDEYPSCIAHKGRRVDWHELLKPGEVGTVMSHKQLIQKAWDKQLFYLVVFEDDAVITDTFDAVQIPEDADYLMLNARSKHNERGEILIGSCGCEGYIITRRGMYKTLQIFEHIDMPIDLLLLAHANSVIKTKASLSTVRNRTNPTLNIYHNKIYCLNLDHGLSTFDRSK